MVFIDTNVFFGLLNRDDSLHAQSIEFFDTMSEANTVSIVTDYVLLELTTIIKLRVKSPKKQTKLYAFCSALKSEEIPNIIFKHTKNSLFTNTFQSTIQHKNSLSFVDNSIIQQALQYKTAQILTFDKAIRSHLINNKLEDRIYPITHNA